jgi:hypothetical protein
VEDNILTDHEDCGTRVSVQKQDANPGHPTLWNVNVTRATSLGIGQGPFAVETEKSDPTNHVISVVTLKGHPLSGWRYWKVYSIGDNDVVIETGAADTAGPGLKKAAGYWLFSGTVLKGWKNYLETIQQLLGAFQAPHSSNSFPEGVYDSNRKEYILWNICGSTSSCN